MKSIKYLVYLPLMLLVFVQPVRATESIGVIKTLSGVVTINRDTGPVTAKLGEKVFAQDELVTASQSTVGLLLNDDARISMGPDTVMKLDQFSFNATTHEGAADVSVKHGTLSVIAGKMTEKTPGALKVKTPAAILAVRGTEFSVKVDPQP